MLCNSVPSTSYKRNSSVLQDPKWKSGAREFTLSDFPGHPLRYPFPVFSISLFARTHTRIILYKWASKSVFILYL